MVDAPFLLPIRQWFKIARAHPFVSAFVGIGLVGALELFGTLQSAFGLMSAMLRSLYGANFTYAEVFASPGFKVLCLAIVVVGIWWLGRKAVHEEARQGELTRLTNEGKQSAAKVAVSEFRDQMNVVLDPLRGFLDPIKELLTALAQRQILDLRRASIQPDKVKPVIENYVEKMKHLDHGHKVARLVNTDMWHYLDSFPAILVQARGMSECALPQIEKHEAPLVGGHADASFTSTPSFLAGHWQNIDRLRDFAKKLEDERNEIAFHLTKLDTRIEALLRRQT